jgi:hypothetical protein
MGHKTSKDVRIKIDNSTGTLVDISTSVNQYTLEQAQTILDDTGMSEHTHSVFPGLMAAPRLPLNGWINSTTEALFGKWIIGTTADIEARTIEVRISRSPARYYNGEVYLEGMSFGGGIDALQTFSMTAVSDGSLNRTSVALA